MTSLKIDAQSLERFARRSFYNHSPRKISPAILELYCTYMGACLVLICALMCGGPTVSLSPRRRTPKALICAHGGAQRMESTEASSSSTPSEDLGRPRRLKAVESPFHDIDRNAYDLDVRHYQVRYCCAHDQWSVGSECMGNQRQ